MGLLVGWVYANFSFDDERYRLLGCLSKIDKIKTTSLKAIDAQKKVIDKSKKLINILDKKNKKIENINKFQEKIIKQQKKLLSLRG